MPISQDRGEGKTINPQKIFEAQIYRNIGHNELANALLISEAHLESFINGFDPIPKEIFFRIMKVLDLPHSFFYQWPRCPNCNCVVEEKPQHAKIEGFNSLDGHVHLRQFSGDLSDYEEENNDPLP